MAPPNVPIDPEAARRFAVEVVARLRAEGYQALWAGGCVRDRILGGHPTDYDVATNATPPQVREVFGARRTLPLGAAFGVITVLGPKQAGHVEVATFRRDVGYSDGRRPDSVAFSSAEEDAQRRDFTINGLFFDPIDEQVIDYVGGQADLNARLIRAIGDPHERFTEDRLRMLRGVRFAATFDFQMHPATLNAIRAQAAEVVVVSAERIAAEMRRMLVHPKRATAVEWLLNADLLPVILPEWPADDMLAFLRTMTTLASLQASAFGTALAVLLRPLFKNDPGIVQRVGGRWRLSNEEVDLCQWLLTHEGLARTAAAAPWRMIQPLLVEPHAAELVKYLRAVETVELAHDDRITWDDTHTHIVSTHFTTSTPAADFCAAKLALPPDELNPPPLVTGADLIAIGLRPGPGFKSLLGTIRDAQVEGRVTDKASALAMAREMSSGS